MAYTKTVWTNGSGEEINETNLNKIEQGIFDAYDLAEGAIAESLVDAKGDLIAGTASDTAARVAVGTDGKVLTADSSAAGGVSWQTPAAVPSALLTVASKTANYTATTADQVLLVDASGGAVTITGYTAVGNTGRVLYIKRMNAGANAVTFDPTGAELIDGASTFALSDQYEAITVVSDGTGWQII